MIEVGYRSQSVFVFETVLVIFMMLVSGCPLQVMVRPMLHDRFLCLSVCLSVCNVGLLWPNSWMDQDATRYGGRPRPR